MLHRAAIPLCNTARRQLPGVRWRCCVTSKFDIFCHLSIFFLTPGKIFLHIFRIPGDTMLVPEVQKREVYLMDNTKNNKTTNTENTENTNTNTKNTKNAKNAKSCK